MSKLRSFWTKLLSKFRKEEKQLTSALFSTDSLGQKRYPGTLRARELGRAASLGRTRSEIDNDIGELSLSFLSMKISEPLYCKGLISLAADCLALGDHEGATVLLRGCTDEYFANHYVPQFNEDPLFASKSVWLAEELLRLGIVKQQEEVPVFLFSNKGERGQA